MEFLAELHPAVVHFPIVCFLFYAVLETAGILSDKKYLLQAAHAILVIGVIFSVVAVLTGNQAEKFAEKYWSSASQFPEDLIEDHELFATLTVWFFFAVAVFRTYLVLKKKFFTRIKYIFIIFGIIGALLIIQTGHLGGELVYEHGVGTKMTMDHENGDFE